MTKFAEADIQGRLGAYTLELFDRDDVVTGSTRLGVENDVVIQYGEQGTAYPKQVLKSHLRIDITEGAARVRDVFRGGFDRNRYICRIQGPGVDWTGFVQPESRTLPFSTNVEPERTSLLIADDFAAAKNAVFSEFQVGTTPPNLLEALSRNVGGVAARLDGAFVDAGGTRWGNAEIDDVGPDTFAAENAYDAIIRIAELTRSRVYRALSAPRTLFHSLRDTGQGQGAYRKPELDFESLPGSIVRPDIDEIQVGDGGFQDVEQAGTIRADLVDDYTLLHSGTVRLTAVEGDPSDSSVEGFRDFYEAPFIQLMADGGVPESLTSTALAELGVIDPEDNRGLGMFVEWEIQEDSSVGNRGLTVRFLDGGSVEQTVDGFQTSSLQFPAQSASFEPRVEFEGRGVVVRPRARYIDGEERIVERLFNQTSPTGVEKIEFESGTIPYVNLNIGLGSFPRARQYENSDLGITAGQPFLARFQMERAYRPFGIQSVQAEVFGLHGPEDLLVLPVPDGNSTRDAAFVCGKGRTVNLTKGTTRISDVEIPSDILPTAVL